MKIPEFKKNPQLMRFIHTLSSEQTSRGHGKKGMRRGGKFRTGEYDKNKGGYYGGDWPEHIDWRLSHDVAVKGTKTGEQRIYQWLDSLNKKKDTDPHAILITPDPNAPMIWYLTRKTGTLSPAERQQMFGDTDKQLAWKEGISVKAGYFMRAITIDQETGEPTSEWVGTLGQLMKYVNDDSVLYIMEDERRAADKYDKRREDARIDKEKFIEYFSENYIEKVNIGKSKQVSKLKDKFSKDVQSLDVDDFGGIERGLSKYGEGQKEISSKVSDLLDIARDISSGNISKDDLSIYYDKFIEYLGDSGDYKTDEITMDNKADLKDVINKHSMMGTCTKFLQYIVTGKVASVYTDVMKDLGIDIGSVDVEGGEDGLDFLDDLDI